MNNSIESSHKKERTPGNILLVDDTPANLHFLSDLLTTNGFKVRIANSGSLALMTAQNRPPDLILLDIMMPGMDGYGVCRKLKEDDRTKDVPVLFISALEETVDKVLAFEVGGVDFITKPFQPPEVLARLRTHLALRKVQAKLEQQKAQLEQQKAQLEQEIAERRKTEEELSKYQDSLSGILERKLRHPEVFKRIRSQNEKMQSIFQYIEALACSSEPVLVTGESGVGKELIARAVHEVSRTKGPWVPVNIAGLDDNVFSDTLFGHVKGAFTGADQARAGMIEKASGGTLFLDEIGDLSPASQIKLLRLLQEKEYMTLGSDKVHRLNARIIVATNIKLNHQREGGGFRKDLFFRLRTHHIEIPPLRERPEDISLLLNYFLEEAAREMGKKKPTPPAELAILLSNYSFPGNIRELRAMVFDAVSMHKGGTLSMALFKKSMGLEIGDSLENQSIDYVSTLVTFHDRLPTLKQVAELLVREAIKRTEGNQSMAARLLGITQPSLSGRLKKIGLNIRKPAS